MNNSTDNNRITSSVDAVSHLTCEHPTSKIVYRPDVRGRPRYQRQCQNCGTSVGNFIAVAEVARMMPMDRVPDWSSELETAGELAARKAMTQHWDQRRASYHEYLKTDAWREKAALVHKRAGGLCEGCRSARSTQVHHLTYDHVEQEFLWELVAVCDACHERYHGDSDAEDR